MVQWKLLLSVSTTIWAAIFWLKVAWGPVSDTVYSLNYIELGFEVVFFIETILLFFTGIPYSMRQNHREFFQKAVGDNEQKEIGYIYDLRKIAHFRLRTTFFFDFVALLPTLMFYWVVLKGRNSWLYRLYYLKFFRIIGSGSTQSFHTVVKDFAMRVSARESRRNDYIINGV